MQIKSNHYKWLFMLIVMIISVPVYSATLNLTTKYGKTGGLRGNMNSIGDQVNGNIICTQNNTNANIEAGCDMSDNAGYVAGGNTPVDDSYTGDLVVRTNDNFELVAAWSWLGNAGGAEEQVTISSTLPAGTNFIFDGIPGACDGTLSSLSADGKTISCVRKDFDTNNVGSYAEDLAFAVRVEGDATNGDMPGALSMSINDPTTSGPVTDGTEGTSLIITASPRWNVDKHAGAGYYTLQSGRTDDLGNPGWWIWYNFSIEVDEVDGETDSPINPALGNEALQGGTNATVTFTDDLSMVSPNAKLVTWDTIYAGSFSPASNACDMDSNYSNGDEPYTVFNSTYPDRSIQVAPGVMNVTCTQTGSTVAVTVSGIDGTLTKAPVKNRNGGLLPVNRNIAAVGVMRVFVPLSDVVAAGGSLTTTNCLTNFDPNGVSGGSNFGAGTESEVDNCRDIVLNAVSGGWDKNFRKGWSDQAVEIDKWGGDGWWLPATDGSIVEAGDATVTPNGVWGTYTVHTNTGGTPFTNVTLCDVIDTETYEMTIIDPTTDNPGTFLDDRIHAVDLNYSNTESNAGITIEYATGYVSTAWPPNQFEAPATSAPDEVVDECSDPSITWYSDVVTAEAADGAPVSKVRVTVPSLNPGFIVAMRIKHTARANFLTSGLPIPNDQLLINHSTYTRDGLSGTVGGDGRTWRAGDYFPNDASMNPGPAGASGGGDRIIMVRAKARILKSMGPGAVSPGSETTVTLTPSFTTDGANPEVGTVVIADLLPEGMNYKFGSTTGDFGPGPTFYGEPLVIHPTTDADCTTHVPDVIAEGFPCGTTLNGGAPDTTILVWDLGMQQTGINMNDLVFNGTVAIDAAPTTLQNYVQISSSADTSPSSQRVANANTSNTVPSSLLIVKSVQTPLHEINSTTAPNNWMQFRIGLRNGSSDPVSNLDFIDVLPFNGDGVTGSFTFTPAPGTTVDRSRIPASNFSGTLDFDSVSFDANSGDCDVTTLEYWFTGDTGVLDVSPKNTAKNDTATGSSNWCQGTATGPGGCNGLSNASVTAFRIIGPEFVPSGTCFVNVIYATSGLNKDQDIYSNTSGAEVIGVTNAVLSNTVSAQVFAGSIGDLIWNDVNNNGVYDAGEELAGIPVTLTPPAGVDLGAGVNVTIMTTTDANGNYLFEDLPAGAYTVTVDDSSINGVNTVDPDTGNPGDSTSMLTLAADEDNLDQDFAYSAPGSIGDTIWDDANNDGIIDPGEGLVGVDVTLTPPANVDLGAGFGVPITTTTDATGNYLFSGLPQGNYTVTVDTSDLPARLQVPGSNTIDPDGGSDSISTVSLGAGEDNLDQDFGYYVPVVISGHVGIDLDNDNIQDHDPLEPVTINLVDPITMMVIATTMTDAFGNYSFDVPADMYIVVEAADPTGTVSVIDIDGGDPNSIAVDATTGDVPGNNFVDEPELGDLEGTVFRDQDMNGNQAGGGETGIPNIDIIVTDAYGVQHPVTTDASGFYSVPNLPAGPVTITVDSSDPDIPEGAAIVFGLPGTETIVANMTVVHNIGYFIPPVTGIDPASIAVCADPSSITWEGSTVSSASVWTNMSAPATNTFTTNDFATNMPAVGVTMTLEDTSGQFNYDDALVPMSTSHGGTSAAFGIPYLSLYLGKQANPSGVDGFQLTGGLVNPDSAKLVVTFDQEVLLDNWRVRDMDSGDVRGVPGWDWQDAVQITGFDAANNPVEIIATLSGVASLIEDADGFVHTDIANNPGDATGGGTNQVDEKGHVVYTSNGVPIIRLEIIHKAGPEMVQQTRSAIALSGFAICTPLVISGTIYNDGNGNTGGVDGTVISATDGDQLYAHLVDDTGTVIGVVPIAADGTYEFTDHININTDYTIALSTVQTPVGDALPAPVLTTDWNNSSEIASGDAAINGIIAISVVTSDVTGIDFGVNKKPIAMDVNEPVQDNPGGVMTVVVPTLIVSDPEDGVPTTIVIDTLPTTGTLFYMGAPVLLGQVITNYVPALLTVDPDTGNVTVVFDYHAIDAAGVASDPATVTMPFTFDPPTAVNNSDSGLVSGTSATVNVLGNDNPGTFPLDPSTVQLVNTTLPLGATLSPDGLTLTVPGEGVWTVLPSGEIMFTPAPGFTDDPTPITYTVEDTEGNITNEATVTLDYLPQASDDEDLDNSIGDTVAVSVLGNDNNGDSINPATIQIVGTMNPGDPLVVPGEGTWTVDLGTGEIIFTPEPDFIGDPTPITYTVEDDEGNLSNPATVTITYLGASIGNFVWLDDRTTGTLGIQDPGEPGIPGITVRLLDENGMPVDDPNQPGIQDYVVVTDGMGGYLFENLSAGTYQVQFVAPATHLISPIGVVLNPDVVDSNPEIDSDASISTGITANIDLAPGDFDNTIDAGMHLISGSAIDLLKTVYVGHDAGAGCPGLGNADIYANTDVTYCFTVTNTGTTILADIAINDAVLGITEVDMTLLSGTLPIAPSGTVVYYYDATATGDLVNTADVNANPVDADGNDIPGIPDVSGVDTATVSLLIPEMELTKSVYLGHDSGASCPGTGVVTLSDDADVTFCFVVTNTGEVDLADVAINDITLGVTDTDMVLVSGSSPLAPTQTMVWAYETTLTQSVENIAQATANPIDNMGNDIPVLVDEEAGGNAAVNIIRMIPTLNMYSILFTILMLLVTGYIARRRIYNL
jgi:CshA-type fibril repeat protein